MKSNDLPPLASFPSSVAVKQVIVPRFPFMTDDGIYFPRVAIGEDMVLVLRVNVYVG